jgi:Ca2+-transporting ATPase
MRRPPRRRDAPLIGGRLLLFSLLAGTSLLVADLAIYAVARMGSLPEPAARGLAFTALVMGNLTLIQLNRSFSQSMLRSMRVPNRPAWAVTLVAGAMLVAALYAPGLSTFFGLTGLHVAHFGLAALVGIVSVAWIDVAKRLVRATARPAGVREASV